MQTPRDLLYGRGYCILRKVFDDVATHRWTDVLLRGRGVDWHRGINNEDVASKENDCKRLFADADRVFKQLAQQKYNPIDVLKDFNLYFKAQSHSQMKLDNAVGIKCKGPKNSEDMGCVDQMQHTDYRWDSEVFRSKDAPAIDASRHSHGAAVEEHCLQPVQSLG